MNQEIVLYKKVAYCFNYFGRASLSERSMRIHLSSLLFLSAVLLVQCKSVSKETSLQAEIVNETLLTEIAAIKDADISKAAQAAAVAKPKLTPKPVAPTPPTVTTKKKDPTTTTKKKEVVVATTKKIPVPPAIATTIKKPIPPPSPTVKPTPAPVTTKAPIPTTITPKKTEPPPTVKKTTTTLPTTTTTTKRTTAKPVTTTRKPLTTTVKKTSKVTTVAVRSSTTERTTTEQTEPTTEADEQSSVTPVAAARTDEKKSKGKKSSKEKFDFTWIIVIACVGALLLFAVVFVVVFKLFGKKDQQSKDGKGRKNGLSSDSTSDEKGKKGKGRKRPNLKNMKQMQAAPVTHKDHHWNGPLKVTAGVGAGPMKHVTDGEKSWSLKEIQFDVALNEVNHIGTDIEFLEASHGLSQASISTSRGKAATKKTESAKTTLEV